jgi:acetyl esterase
MDEAKESWGGTLRPFRHKGEVNWMDRSSPGQVFDLGAVPAANVPFVAITSVGWRTRPDLDMNRLQDFSTGVAGIRASMTGIAGSDRSSRSRDGLVAGGTAQCERRSLRGCTRRPLGHRRIFGYGRASAIRRRAGPPMLHPQARTLLDRMEQSGVPPAHELSVPEARAFFRERVGAVQSPPPAVAEVRDLAVDGPDGAIRLRYYRPIGASGGALPVLVYYHGGGWVLGDLDTHDAMCRELANRAGCAVIAVDYRRGPEHRFPAAVIDGIAAARWVHEHATELGLDGSRLAVGGDSAGGNLAAVVSIAARDGGELPIAFQLLIYPATDMHCTAPSHAENGRGYMLPRETLAWFIRHYVADPAQYSDWRASPLLHPDLSRLPPALVLTAGFDPLRDEAAAYAKRLTAAGNRASYVLFARQMHGFVSMSRLIDEAETALALCAAELRRALQPAA